MTPVAQDANITTLDPEECPPAAGQGTIVISDGAVLVGSDLIDVADLTVELYNSPDITNVANRIETDPGDPDANGTKEFTPYAVGTYYIKIVVDANPANPFVGVGCEIPPYRVDLEDKSVDPTINVAVTASQSCTGPGTGSITLVFDQTKPLKSASGYNLTWISYLNANGVSDPSVIATFNDPAATNTPAPFNDLPAGTYTIQVIDNDHGCSVQRVVTVDNKPITPQLLNSNVLTFDPDNCTPLNGTISVLEGALTLTDPLTSTTTAIDLDNLLIELWSDADLTIPVGTKNFTAGDAQVLFSDLGDGTYFISVQVTSNSPSNIGVGCEIAPFRVDLFDFSQDPILSFDVPEPDINCFNDATQGNGSVLVTSNSNIVTWDWFERDLDGDGIFNEPGDDDEPLTAGGGSIDTDVVIDSIEYTGLAPGIYRLMIVDDHGCSSTTQVEILRDATRSTPNVIDVDVNLTTNCGGNGTFEVSEISIGDPNLNPSITDSLRLATEFLYTWYYEGITDADTVAFEHSSVLDSVAAGTYYVVVTNIASLCESIPKEVVMEETAINYPTVVLEQTIPQLSCQAPYTAQLTATVIENDPTDTDDAYRFEWYYEGQMILPPDASVPDTLGNVSVWSGLPVGRYDIIVYNDSTGCSDQALYIIENESEEFIPVINTGTEPVTNCVSPNGGIFGKAVPFTDANGVNTYPLLPYDYTIDIYTGDLSATLTDTSPPGNLASETGVSAGVNVLASNVEAGFYTVRIIDNKTGCYSVKADQVFDRQTVPVVEVVEDNPLINCDPARANGQLSATADGGRVGGFDFRWHAGTDTTSTVIGNQNKLIGQGAGIFTVVVTNQTSGCIAVMSGEITDGTLPSPTPTPELISDRLSCIEPDGALNVSVDGQTAGYTFNWFDDADGGGTMISDNPFIINLDIGNYSVVAINNTTGCESIPANISVGDARLNPEFTFETEGSKCDEDTGLARIIITNEAVVNEVFWTDLTTGAGLGLGSEINFLAPGDYQADLTTFYGCEGTGVATVGTVITNYNLVTSDGDGINDNFQIDCITNFPNNNVKIFNRAGVLVYKIDGYNNADKSFVGLGEDGVYPIGEELPNGTYYYVIDKGDGSELIAGFLELIR